MKTSISKIISDILLTATKQNANGGNHIEALFRAYRIAAKVNFLNPKIPKSDKIYLNMAVDYYARVLKASREKRFITAYSLGCPVEILYAMDIVPCQLETTGWSLAMLTGETGKLLSAASEAGMAAEICSVHRLIAGAYASQLLPRPNAIIWSNMPCENGAKSGALLAKLNNCPSFFIDHPYRNVPEEAEYLAAEFSELISFLEANSGHRLDYNKLTQAVNRTKHQIDLCREISQMRKNIPSPFPSLTFLRVFMVNILFGGQAEATRYLEALRNELVGIMRKGKGTIIPERFRLMNMNLPPLYFTGPLKRLFQEYGVVEVVNPFFMEWQMGELNSTEPLHALAEKSLMNPLMGIFGSDNQQMLDKLKQYAGEYKIDGAINYAHIGCGSFGGASRMVRDAMREAGVPMLDLPCDITDPTVATPEEMQEQLGRFFELLEDR